MCMRTSATVLLMASLVNVPAVAAADKEHLQIMADIRMLQEQAQQLQLMLGTLADALKGVTAKIDEQGNSTRKAFADQKLLVDTAGTDLRVVREKLDETNVRITSLSQELEAVRQAIPRTPMPVTRLRPVAPAGCFVGDGRRNRRDASVGTAPRRGASCRPAHRRSVSTTWPGPTMRPDSGRWPFRDSSRSCARSPSPSSQTTRST